MPRLGVSALTLVLLISACESPPSVDDTTRLELQPCHLDGTDIAARCGTLQVWEDREARAGRQIALRVAVVEARAEEPRPDPLVIFVGGPGQSATRSGAMLAQVFRDVRKTRDIVLVDQRGTGESNPLRCESEDSTIADALEEAVDPDEVADCLRKLDADPLHYTTPVAMDDLDEVRAALGYEQVNLWGGSYGTRAALEYMRRHPEHVRRVVLDGAAPTDIKLTVNAGRDAQRALDLLFARCASDPGCAARFGDQRGRFQELRARLQQQPESVEFRHPRTGALEQLEVTADRLAGVVRAILYVPTLVATLPLLIERAARGEWEPMLAAFVTIQGSAAQDMADGMFLSVVCAEDLPRITDTERATLSANFVGDTPVRLLKETCALWPAATMPDEYFEPIVTDHPTMVLSGELDPVTPPRWGELVAGRLPNATHHVVEGAAHGVSALPCAAEAIAAFLDAEDPASVSPSCRAKNFAPFLLNPSGARP